MRLSFNEKPHLKIQAGLAETGTLPTADNGPEVMKFCEHEKPI